MFLGIHMPLSRGMRSRYGMGGGKDFWLRQDQDSKTTLGCLRDTKLEHVPVYTKMEVGEKGEASSTQTE